MSRETERRLAEALSGRADEVPFGDAPLAAIGRESARLDRRRRRLVLASVAGVAATAIAAGAVAAWSGSDDQTPARPLPFPSGVTPPVSSETPRPNPTAARTAGPPPPGSATGVPDGVRSSMDWRTRGSLREDAAVLAAARDRMQAEAKSHKLGIGDPTRTDPLTTAVWYAGDTPAGRVVVVAVAQEYDGAFEAARFLVWAGPSGAPVSELAVVGNVGEGLDDDLTLSRLVPSPGGWWMFTLSAPGGDAAKVSWYPQFDARGRAPRTWVDVEAVDGVVVAPAPGRAVAARVAVLRGGETVSEQPVMEDSLDLNDPSFMPPDLTPEYTPTTEWVAARLALVLGLRPTDLAVNRLAADAGANGFANSLIRVRLPSGATLVALVADRPVADGPPLRSLLVAVAPAAVAGGDEAGGSTDVMILSRVWAWLDQNWVVVAAPTAQDTDIRLGSNGAVLQTGRLDGSGFTEFSLENGTAGTDVRVEVAQAEGVWRPAVNPAEDTHTDPFDLRD